MVAGSADVGLDPVLLDVLACPAEDHAPLELGSRMDPAQPAGPALPTLTCTECGRAFPIRDGIPVLLLDEVLPPDGGLGASGTGSGA